VNEKGAALIGSRIRFAPLRQLALTGAALGELGAVLDPLRPLVAPLVEGRGRPGPPAPVHEAAGEKARASAPEPPRHEAGDGIAASQCRVQAPSTQPLSRRFFAGIGRPVNIAFALVLAVVVSGWWVVLRPTSFFGGSATFITVRGTSMLPTLKTGDFVLAEAQSSYEVRDLVVYRVPRGQIGAGDDLIHRIVAGNATIGFTLKGDNNPAPDPWIVPRNDILGKETLAIPGLGNSLLVIRSPLFAGLIAALVAMWLVISPPEWMRRRKPAAAAPDPATLDPATPSPATADPATSGPAVADHATLDPAVPDPATAAAATSPARRRSRSPAKPTAPTPGPSVPDPATPAAATTPARRRARSPAKPPAPTPRPTARPRAGARPRAPRREP
jgi:signal peptidase I